MTFAVCGAVSGVTAKAWWYDAPKLNGDPTTATSSIEMVTVLLAGCAASVLYATRSTFRPFWHVSVTVGVCPRATPGPAKNAVTVIAATASQPKRRKVEARRRAGVG